MNSRNLFECSSSFYTTTDLWLCINYNTQSSGRVSVQSLCARSLPGIAHKEPLSRCIHQSLHCF